MSLIYGPTETISWRSNDYTLIRNPHPSDPLDRENAWIINLHEKNDESDWNHTELWVKYDGLDVNKLQLLHGRDYYIGQRDDYRSPDELHDYVHEYAQTYNLSNKQLAFMVDGLELALHML
jgi:hypothetical protein